MPADASGLREGRTQCVGTFIPRTIGVGASLLV
jgi:hypothetical protein